MSALDRLRQIQEQRNTKPPKAVPTIIPWSVQHDLATGEQTTEYDGALVQAALQTPDDYVIAPVGKVRFINVPERPPRAPIPEPTFGALLEAFAS